MRPSATGLYRGLVLVLAACVLVAMPAFAQEAAAPVPALPDALTGEDGGLSSTVVQLFILPVHSGFFCSASRSS